MMCFAPDKIIISHTFRIRAALVFLCPYIYKREREREIKRESKRERESKSESKNKKEREQKCGQ
jgi:hypothetical protein